MTRPEDKEQERLALEHELCRLGITGYKLEDRDPPDFCMTLGEQTISIEVTDFHRGKLCEIETLWFKAISPLCDIKRAAFPELHFVWANVEFRSRWLPRTREHDRFVDELIAMIRDDSHYIGNQQGMTLESSTMHYPLLSSYVHRVGIRKAAGWKWQHLVPWTSNIGSSGFIALDENELLKICENKIDKIRHWPNDMPKRGWLFVLGGVMPSEIIGNFSAEKLSAFHRLNAALTASQYDRAYLCQARTAGWFRGEGWKNLIY